MTRTPPDTKYKAIVFDFDGVILESAEIKTHGFRELFAHEPEHLDAIVRHHLDNLGISRFKKFEWVYRNLLRRPLPAAKAKQLGERYSALVYERALRCPMVPGAKQLLEGLHGKLPLFVASGTPQEELSRIVEHRSLGRYFVEVCGSPESKESILLRLLAKHQLARSETVMVGDGLSDLEAAESTGIGFVGRVNGEQTASAWPSGTVTVTDLTELGDMLGLRPLSSAR